MNLLNLVLPPVFGFCIGLGTNALAIRMLFRPYREVRFLGLRFQGTLPRRQAEIARTVSRTVASELLREERVAERVAGPEVRQALQELAVELSSRYVGAADGCLSDLLGAQSRAVERFLERFLVDLASLASSWLATEEGRTSLRALGSWLSVRTPAELLRGEEGPARRWLLEKAGSALRDPSLDQRVRHLLELMLVRLAGSDRPLADSLPSELQQSLFQLVHRAIPGLLERFEDLLLSPDNVRRIKRAVRSGIEDYLMETEGGFFKNMVRQAALAGQERINREADQLVDANLHRLRALIYEENNRSQVERGVDEALRTLLRKTPAQLLAAASPERIESVTDELAAWIGTRLRRPRMSRALEQILEGELDAMFHTPLRDLFGAPSDPSGVDGALSLLSGWLAADGLESLARREAPPVAQALLRVPLGSIGRWMTPGVVAEIAELALTRLMPVLSARVPELLRIVDVEQLVEREILSFSAQEVERVVLAVARRELWVITWWGGGLGLLVGGMQSLLLLLSG